MFLNTVEPYTPPMDNQVQLLVENLNLLEYDELIDLSKMPYTDDNWSKIAFSVSKSILCSYEDEDFSAIVKKKISKGHWSFNNEVINCLIYNTSIRQPGAFDFSHGFKYIAENSFIGGTGIYTIYIQDPNISNNMLLRQIANLTQYHVLSGNPFNRLLIALSRPNTASWEVVFVESVYNQYVQNSRLIKILWFKNPSDFFKSILSGQQVGNVEREQFEARIRVSW